MSRFGMGGASTGSAAGQEPQAPLLVDYAAERFERLCVAAGFGEETSQTVETLRSLLLPWGARPIERVFPEPAEDQKRSRVMRISESTWLSEISDDNTPVEFSVAIGHGRTEVRALFEAQGEEPTLESYREAGIALMERLERECGADLTRFRQLQDLFLPQGMCGPFTVWASVVFAPKRPPSFKAYFNPQARGPGRAGELVDEGLRRLGLPRTWATLCRTIARRGPHLDELKYFALDLTSEPQARIKVYVRHHEATPSDLEVACSGAQEYVQGEALHFARAMAGGDKRLTERATFTCSAFVEGTGERPISTTLYVPVCAYANNDAAVKERVNQYLTEQSPHGPAYNAIIDQYTNRPLDAGVGMQSWVAFRRYQGETRLTVYLSTEATQVFPPRAIPASTVEHTTYGCAEDVLHCVGRYSLAEHPLVKRLQREPENGGPLWLLVANMNEGISKPLVHWLANLTARADDEHIRRLLARQLDRDMGQGVVDRSIGQFMKKFLRTIAPLRPADLQEESLAPGRRLAERLSRIYLSEDPLEGIAALMAVRICAHQLVEAVEQLILAQPYEFDADLLEWARVNQESDTEDSFKLAQLVSSDAEAISATVTGAMGLHTALWECLDEIYAACFAGSLKPPKQS